MKKLNKLVLHKAKMMTAPQMKHITGGYDLSEYDDNGDGTVYECMCGPSNAQWSVGFTDNPYDCPCRCFPSSCY